ncbi:MAG: SRPBCC domain-containing protein [Chloroflexi bacterium]|nr:SRPBCC domain-containing protein [Chloroflexota bacterium]
MADIRHRVSIKAPLEDVYQAVATREGVAGWWTRTVEGDSREGGELRFFFGQPEPSATMHVRKAKANQRVEWRCIQGPEEWLDTDILFDIRPEGDETVLMFTHADWREPVEFMHHCSSRWGYFLLSLKAGLEGRQATPWPEDLRF